MLSSLWQLGGTAFSALINSTSFFLYHSLSPFLPLSISLPLSLSLSNIVYILMLIMTVVMTASLALKCTQPLQLSDDLQPPPPTERQRERHTIVVFEESYMFTVN